jgi:hypothetical protein
MPSSPPQQPTPLNLTVYRVNGKLCASLLKTRLIGTAEFSDQSDQILAGAKVPGFRHRRCGPFPRAHFADEGF